MINSIKDSFGEEYECHSATIFLEKNSILFIFLFFKNKFS